MLNEKNMGLINNSAHRILNAILRHTHKSLTISEIRDILKISHVGTWKALKKLESEKIVILRAAGNKKNSTYSVYLNWDNPLVEKTLALALENEAASQRKWLVNFAELENKIDFLILYGSILTSPQKSEDIDLISVVSKKNVSTEIERIIMKVQKTQIKPIHNIIFAPANLKYEIKKPNKAFINALKEGVILFGQNKFVKFMRSLQHGS